jgi:hypothetical protein
MQCWRSSRATSVTENCGCSPVLVDDTTPAKKTMKEIDVSARRKKGMQSSRCRQRINPREFATTKPRTPETAANYLLHCGLRQDGSGDQRGVSIRYGDVLDGTGSMTQSASHPNRNEPGHPNPQFSWRNPKEPPCTSLTLRPAVAS